MAIDLSSIGFPNHITGIQNEAGEWFRGGYNYQTNHNGWTSATVVKEHLRLENIMHVQSDNVSYESDWVTYYTAPNGYKFQYKIQQYARSTGDPYGYVQAAHRVMNEDETVQLPSNAIPYFHPEGSTSQLLPLMNWGSAVFDFYLTTWYYPNSDPPDDTPCIKLQFDVMVGLLDAPNPYNFHVGVLYGNEINAMWSDSLAYWEATATALSGYDTYMHQHGNPYTGDSFTDEEIPGEPAGGDDTSTTGGGHGSYDNTSDPIDFPGLPTNGALTSGAIRAHRVSEQTLLSIMTDLWDTSLFDISTWQKAITDPMNAIVSLHALPFSPDVAADTENIFIGNMDMHVTAPKVTSQYKEISFTAVNVDEYWGSAMDFSPYVKVELFLPFIKTVTLAPEDVIGNTIEVKYHIDVLTGDCIAFIKCGSSVLYRFNGNCKMQIPLTVQSNSAAADIHQRTPELVGKVATGGVMGAVDASITAASSVAASKISTQRSGDISGSISLMDDFIPYLIIHRPKQSLAKDYNKFKGYPSNITRQLSTLKGYTEVEHVNLSVPGATDAELDEIKNLLQSGVII